MPIPLLPVTSTYTLDRAVYREMCPVCSRLGWVLVVWLLGLMVRITKWV